jgi:hypothetical protein
VAPPNTGSAGLAHNDGNQTATIAGLVLVTIAGLTLLFGVVAPRRR